MDRRAGRAKARQIKKGVSIMRKYKYHQEMQAPDIFAYCLTAQSAWVISDINEDRAIMGYAAMDRTDAARRYKVQYTAAKEPRPYVRANGIRLYLDQFMRTRA